MKNLDELRFEVDAIDVEIQKLLTSRANLALEIGKSKEKIATKQIYYSPEREAAILKMIAKRNLGPIKNEALLLIFKDIISACRVIQSPAKIAFLGPLGTFSHEATINIFGEDNILSPQSSIKEAIAATQQREADYCVIPIENSNEGVVTQTLDHLIQTSLTICNEITLPIHHYLLGRCGSLQEINQVYSHPQALAQCQGWLEKNLPNAALFPVKNSAQVCILAAKEANTAAIAGKISLEHYNLNIIETYIEDAKNNTTRFYVLGNQITKPTGHDKTSLLISIPHKPGTLVSLLNCFAKNGVNLTLIQSRPYKHRLWEYIFFIEIQGHQLDKNISTAIKQLSDEHIMSKILGSFPRAIS